MKKAFLLLSILFISTCLYSENNSESTEKIDKTFSINDAIECALNNNADILNQQAALMYASGQLKQAKGNYDVKVGAEAGYTSSYSPTDKNNPSIQSGEEFLYQFIEGQQLTTKAYVEKLFAFGINARLNYQLSRATSKYRDGLYETLPYYDYYGHPKNNNTGNISLEVSVPILKSFNSAVADNNLKLANDNYEAMECNFQDTVAKVIMQTSETYWKFYISYEKVNVIKNLNQKSEERKNNISKLVSAGVRNKNERLQIEVNAMETARQLENAKLEYLMAKTELAQQIGIHVEEIEDPEITMPEINFNDENFPNPDDYDRTIIEEIILARPDMVALEKNLKIAEQKVRIAQIEKRPDLNLSLNVGTTGNSYGDDFGNYFTSPYNNVRGVNWGGSLIFSMPIQNNAKKGELMQAEASYTEALTKLNRQKNIFSLQLNNAISALNSYKDIVKNAEDILNMQKEVFENEQKRFEAGLSSVDYLIQQDSSWLQANLNYYQTYETYLKYVMEFKYYTTGLVTVENELNNLYLLLP